MRERRWRWAGSGRWWSLRWAGSDRRPRGDGASRRSVFDLARAVEEGVMIARVAVTVSVANRILVRALRNGIDYDPEATEVMVREELARIAAEQLQYARKIVAEQRRARGSRGRASHQHDYRSPDVPMLRTREAVYSGVAAELQRQADDPAAVDALVAASRDRALDQIGRPTRNGFTSRSDPDYGRDRAERMRLLREIDLPLLGADRHRRITPLRGTED